MRTLLKISLLAIVSFQASCVTADYVGRTYSPTTRVDLFYDRADVDRPFETMGSIRLEATDLMSYQQMERDLIKQAKRRGADAILIDGMDTVVVGSPANLYGIESISGSDDPHYYTDMYGRLKETGSHEDLPATPYPADVQYKVLTGKLLKYK